MVTPGRCASRYPALAALVACLLGTGIAAAGAVAGSRVPSPDDHNPNSHSQSAELRCVQGLRAAERHEEEARIRHERAGEGRARSNHRPATSQRSLHSRREELHHGRHRRVRHPRHRSESERTETSSRRVVRQRLTMELTARSDGGQFRLERYFTEVGSEHGHPVLRAAIDAYVPVQFDFRDRFGKAAIYGSSTR